MTEPDAEIADIDPVPVRFRQRPVDVSDEDRDPSRHWRRHSGRFQWNHDDSLDEYPHGRCWCGGAYNERGVCQDRCARDSWDR